MTSTRLSALDASFLAAETPTAHMHVGWAALFEPPENGPRPSFEELRAHVGARLDRAPRYRQRLAPTPLDVHAPLWVDDEDFDLDRHVLRAQATDLDSIVSAVMSTPLERSRPLWECWIAPQLDDGRIGVVGKVHHCMVDGLAAVELAGLLLDPEPEAAPLPSSDWRPERAPGALARLAQGLVDRVGQEVGALRQPLGLLRSRARIAAAASGAREVATSVVHSVANPATPTPALNPELSPLRHLARFARPMDDIMRVKNEFGTTVNDVVLAAACGGVRTFLEEHGDDVHGVKAMVPVAQRDAEEAAGLGNRISFLFIDLPCDESDPVSRLLAVNAITRECKASGEAHGGDLLLNALALAPQPVQRWLTKLVASPRTFNLVVSNIPGPPGPMWMRGSRLREAYPIVPLSDRHAVAIGVTTLADGAFFGLYADRKMLPDAGALADAIDRALDELVAACLEEPPRRPKPPAGNGGRRNGAGREHAVAGRT